MIPGKPLVVLAVDSHVSSAACSRRSVLLAALGAAVAGCGSSPRAPERPPEPVTLAVSLAARADANPDVRGRASPLAVRVFELRSVTGFESADFFALYERDQATLGSDLVARTEFVLRPGEAQEFVRKAGAETRFLGAIAGYRDLERSIWRVVAPIAPPTFGERAGNAPSRQQRVRLTFERAAVRMDVATVS